MVADSKLTGILIGGTHAARPAATAVVAGSTYSCTTHALEYQSDGATWATRSTFGGPTATRASLGLDTTDSPEFLALNVGAATDTTITRTAAGEIAVEGNRIFRVGGADVPIADGGTGASTATLGFDALSPMTTAGDLIVGGVSGTRVRLAKGSDSQVLTVDPSTHLLVWATPSSGFANPMTTKGDVIIGDTGGSPIRLAVGTDGKALVADAASTGGIKWDTVSGSGAPTTSKYVTTAADAGLSAELVIPGLAGSVDRVAGGGSDDEFDAFSGWTTYGTLDTNNASDFPSHWHGKRVLGAASLAGIYKATPSMPFTMTAKISEGTLDTDNQFIGLAVLEASPGKATFFGQVHNSGSTTCSMYRWTTATAFASSVNGTNFSPAYRTPTFRYIRIIVASSTDVTLQISATGYRWRASGIASQNPSLTIANVGLVIGDVAGASTVEGVFDWVRFT